MTELLLSVKHLNKTIRQKEILHDVSFDVPYGKIIGFCGSNGAGKTTTFKCILNLISYSGSILIDGLDTKKSLYAQGKIGSTIEGPNLYENMSGLNNLKMAAMYYYPIVQKGNIDDVVNRFCMEGYINNKVSTYSLGMKQRLCIAMSMVHSPDLLILDEPMNGLDPEGIYDLRSILKSYCHDQMKSIFVSSHILTEMKILCDQVLFIKEGQILGNETVNDKLEERYISIMKGNISSLK